MSSENQPGNRKELIILYASTLLLRTGFGGAIILFDWTLVWGIEHILGVAATSSFTAITMISLTALTYYIAEITLTGYYGHRSDIIGVKPILVYATAGAGIALLFYSPGSILFGEYAHTEFGLILLALYLAAMHFVHGIFASAKVAPTLGYINNYSTVKDRALHMAYYDNMILYGRAFGLLFGGFLWIILNVDGQVLPNGQPDIKAQGMKIAETYPFLALLLLIAWGMVYFGLEKIEPKGEPRPFSLKHDIPIAAKVMLKPERRPMLIPWISISALIGSASLWGPTISFILSKSTSSHRGYNALLPLMFALIGIALPAPLWGRYADRHGRKRTLLLGMFGLPIMGILGLAIGFPFYHTNIAIDNVAFLTSLLPGAFMFSALIPVLMGALGDTSEMNKDGEIMSGYHFVIASGEILGVIGAGLLIGIFAVFNKVTGLFGQGQHGNDVAILIGFVLFEMVLVVGMVLGIYRLPEQKATYH